MITSSYRVAIARINGTGEKAGFIDPTRLEYYMADKETPTVPSSFVLATDKERANQRWKWVIQSLQMMGNLYVSDIDAAGGDANSAPTTLSFTLTAERGDGMLITRDEENEGEELLGEDAIRRCIARALMQKRDELLVDILDPASTTGSQNGSESETAIRTGPRVVTIEIGELASNLGDATNAVTVTKI